MKPSITLGRLFGVDIGLHDSWAIIALLITLSLAGQFSATNSHWSRETVWAAALITAVLFFASIVLHELSHALVARVRGVAVRSITLFALGGVAANGSASSSGSIAGETGNSVVPISKSERGGRIVK